MDSDSNQAKVTQKKAPIIFYVIMGVFPILFFVMLEVGLRIGGYGHEYKMFVKLEGYNPEMLYVNPDMSYKYFGNLIASVFSSGTGFLEEKPGNSFRVFVMGGSSAQGFPYMLNRNASFPAQLKLRLDKLYPEQTIEVVNLGASAINSHTLLDILPNVLNQSPDLILIYAGHNEYYGALGPGSSKSMNPVLARIMLYLRDFRTMQLMENLIVNLRKKGAYKDNSLMQKMIGESSIEMGSDTYQKGLEQYNLNITSILKKIKAADVPVMIGTLSSNISGHKPFNATQKDKAGLSSNDYFERGKKLIASGDSIAAKAHLILAKELDGLRFRAPEGINHLIRKKAKSFEVPLVDIDSIFSLNSPNNITGNELMCDHLHPNMDGYFLMSKSYYQEMKNNNYLPGTNSIVVENEMLLDSILRKEFPYSRLDSLVARRLLLTGLGSYPFVPIGSINPYQDQLDNDGLEFNTNSREAIDSVRMSIAGEYILNKDSIGFAREMSVFISELPSNEYLYMKSIQYLTNEKLIDKVYPIVLNQLKTMKDNISKNKMIGKTYMSLKFNDSAAVYLEKALKLSPNDTSLLLDLGFIHLELEQFAKAANDFTKVIDLLPNNKEAYHQLGVTQFELKNYQGTVQNMTQVIRLTNPPESLPYLIRGYANFGLKDNAGYCDDWNSAAELGSSEAKSLSKKYCPKN